MNKKILLIDDELNIRLLYKEELEEDGYIVETAKDAKEGYEKFKKFSPDLIILDIKMPEISGMEVLQKFKGENKDTPVILFTAFGEFKHEFRAWAADEYIIKSSDIDELKNAIKKYV